MSIELAFIVVLCRVAADASESESLVKLRESVQKLEQRCKQLESERNAAQDECTRQQRDFDDLLVLLADQDLKLSAYSAKFGELDDSPPDETANDADVPAELPSDGLKSTLVLESQLGPNLERRDTRLSESPTENRSGTFSFTDYRNEDTVAGQPCPEIVTGRLSLTHESETEGNGRSNFPEDTSAVSVPNAQYSGYDYYAYAQYAPPQPTNYYQIPNSNSAPTGQNTQYANVYASNTNYAYYATDSDAAAYSATPEISFR